MKNLDFFSKRLFTITVCLCAILLCSGFFLFSVKTVSAKQNEFSSMSPIGVAGKYMMQYVTWMPEQGVVVRQILVWDTETGKSKRYSLNDNSEWVLTDTQLPEKPL